MKRLSPSDRIRTQIDEVFADPDLDLADAMEDVARLSVRLVLQAVLEEEVTEFLGRDRYQRGDASRAGSRNGFSQVTVKTTAGPVCLDRPKLRGTDEQFCSKLLGKRVLRTNPLEALVISCWVRGLSDRDVEAMLAEALGPDASLSKSTVSRICSRLKEQFEEWRTRGLSGIDVDYLYLDGSHFRMHDGAKAEPVLVAYAITSQGKPALVHVALGGSESTDAWADFLGDMIDRGLRPPLLGISDGGQGLINAIETSFPVMHRQRCLIHRARNVLAKIPPEYQDAMKAEYWQIFEDITAPPGPAAVQQVQSRIDAFAEQHRKSFPSAVKCLLTDRAALTNYLHFPAEHWHRIRHTNLIERTFGETRRRVKVIGRLPGEQTCLTLVWAVLERASAGWRGVHTTPAITVALTKTRLQLYPPSTTQNPEQTTTTEQAA